MKKLTVFLSAVTLLTAFFTLSVFGGTIEGKFKTDGNYKYIYFGQYNEYPSFYSDLINQYSDYLPSDIQQDNNSSGLHMTIENENLLQNPDPNATYTFEYNDNYYEFHRSGKDKLWFVKELQPADQETREVFRTSGDSILHMSIAYSDNKANDDLPDMSDLLRNSNAYAM